MPDIQEVFRMATQKVRPDPGAVERQRRKQRGKLVRERVAGYALAAGLVAAGVVVGISTLRSSDEPAVPASQGAPPTFMGAQLAGVWLQTGTADPAPHKVLTFTTDGTFVMEAADRDAYGAVDGTYQVQGDTITFTDPERGCPLMKWTGGPPGGGEAVPRAVDIEFTITDTGAGDCTAPSGFHVEGTRVYFVRISPRSLAGETDDWELDSEFKASRHPQEAPPSLQRLAGIWFEDDGDHVLRISPDGEYTIGVGEAFVTDPANTGTISVGNDGTIEFTSGPDSGTCVDGTVMTWRDVRVARYALFADVEVEGDPCGGLPVGPTSWHNLIRY
jgi:hypothetical protein